MNKIIEIAKSYVGQKELWKSINGFDNYQISNTGRVKSLNYNHTGKEKILKPIKNMMGYYKCNLMQDGVRKNKVIHRLVAEAFIPNTCNLNTVNHKDFDKSNNNYKNLEWLSLSDNLKDSHSKEHVKYSRGENHYKAILSDDQVLKVRELIHSGISGRNIGYMFNVSEKYISAIKRHKSRIHTIL